MVKKLLKILSNSWPPIEENLTVYDSLQQKLFSLFLKVLSYPATAKVCKTPSLDVHEALRTVPTQRLQDSNNKPTYKAYLKSPCVLK